MGIQYPRIRSGHTDLDPATFRRWPGDPDDYIRYARSADGSWAYEQQPDGTWTLTHLTDGGFLEFLPSLGYARALTFDRTAITGLAAQDARRRELVAAFAADLRRAGPAPLNHKTITP